MYVGILLPVVEFIGDDTFPVSICEEDERTGGYDAYECRSKTFEQSAKGFFAVDIAVSNVLISWVNSIGFFGTCETYRMMYPVSTKLYNRFVGRGADMTMLPPFPIMFTAACFWRKRSDCSRVLTTSNGLVTMAPHIPPNLVVENMGISKVFFWFVWVIGRGFKGLPSSDEMQHWVGLLGGYWRCR